MNDVPPQYKGSGGDFTVADYKPKSLLNPYGHEAQIQK